MPRLELAPDTAIHYEWIDGNADRPCLLFLHEGLGCTAMWKDFPRRLCAASGCSGLLYDRIGYGLSSALVQSRSIHYLHEYALIELPQVIARLIPNRDYCLIGHSDGGSIGLIHAAARPARLRALITEAAHIFVEAETLAGIRVANTAYAEGKLKSLARYHGDKSEQTFHSWADTWLNASYAAWNIEYLLPAIACPTLVIQGENDQYATRAQVDVIVAKAADATPALLPACAHSPHLEQPDAVIRLVLDFLSGNGTLPAQEQISGKTA